MTESECKSKIMTYKREELFNLWQRRHDDNFLPDWPKGKFFEYAILREFELEGAKVRYPYNTYSTNDIGKQTIIEQIDGVIYIDGISALVESKDYSEQMIDIEPLAKLQVRLKRRPPTVIGCVFSATDFTWPAVALIETFMPNTILLWNKKDIEYCFKNQFFTEGLRLKYKNVIEECNHIYDLATYDQLIQLKKK
jgi:hypothetical protein